MRSSSETKRRNAGSPTGYVRPRIGTEVVACYRKSGIRVMILSP